LLEEAGVTDTNPPALDLAIDPAYAEQQLNDKLGVVVTEAAKDRVVATMPAKGNLQPYGLLYGGANASLAETLGSICAALNAGEGRVAMGLELSCTHHRGVREGIVTGVATPVHVGRGTVTVEIAIADEAWRRTCTARLTCVIRDAAPGA
jgi:1,4-dihydroxy-2-naphthoyl-CoA hydrolase